MPDLPGHGATPVCAELSLWQLADALARLCRTLTEAPLVIGGYSMGGRIALHVLIRHRAALQAAVVLGASPGLADDAQRATRRRDDDALAARILAEPSEWFAEYWQRQPIFATQHTLPPDVQAMIRAERLACNRAGLATALRNWGTGVQENLLPPLSELDVPTLLLAGELDPKFCASNATLTALMPRSRLAIIPGAGHAAQLEQPARFAAIVRRYLSEL